MPKISTKKHSKTGTVIIAYNCSDGRLFYYTRQKGNDKSSTSILNRMYAAIEQLESDHRIKNIPLKKAVVRSALDRILFKKADNDIIFRLSDIIDKMEAGKIVTPSKKKYTKGSIKTFRFTVDLLTRYGSAEVTMENYQGFIKWCHDLDYSTNYIGGQIKNWRSLAKLAGIDVPEGFSKIAEDAIDVYLDESEIELLIHADNLSEREKLIRDWFVIDCYTGLRVSDLLVLTEKNINDGFIQVTNKKTSEKVVIPVHPHVKKILQKHKGLPRKVSDVEINRTIKDVAEKAGLTGTVLHTMTKGGKRKDEYFKKYEMISCHTSRRSFITNLRKSGEADSVIMKLTGIRSMATLLKYDKITPEQAATVAAKGKFFK
jgi:integrase